MTTEAEPSELEQAWSTHISADVALLESLVTRHRERQRRYHKVGHVEAVLRHVADLADIEPVDDLGAVVAAAFYHDAIYEPMHPANERASARLARRDLDVLGWPAERIERVAAMVEATREHVAPADIDTAVLLDADLAILGAPADEYLDYAGKVRAEYMHYDDGEWSAGRSAVLQGLLDRESIFATTIGRTRWEDAARANIAAELAELQR